METYYDLGINWIWYLDVTLNQENKTVFIHNHYRIHKYEGDKHPECIGGYSLVENNKREVTAVYLQNSFADTNLIYAVENPKYIFDYGKR